jgi:integrase
MTAPASSETATRKQRGIRRLKTSYQAYLDFRGVQYTQTFPFTTTLSTMKDWRDRKRSELKYGTPKTSRTFQVDADEYLLIVTGMPSYQDRKFHVEQWAHVFGHRDRKTLTATDIRIQLEQWRQGGRYDGKGLSAGSLNRRRTALMAMFTALDGRSQPNVVKDVPAYDERASHQIRARPMLEMAKVIRQVRVGCESRARLSVLLWTGWTSQLLKQVQDSHVDWTRGAVTLARRQKGKGLVSIRLPLLPRALAALRRLKRMDALGPFSNGSLHSCWERACDNAGVPRSRVYDLRHSFATWAASQIKDDRALSELLRTKSIARYTEGATTDRMGEALQVLQGLTRTQKDSQGYSRGERATKEKRGRAEISQN